MKYNSIKCSHCRLYIKTKTMEKLKHDAAVAAATDAAIADDQQQKVEMRV